jgi:hypothetical protein
MAEWDYFGYVHRRSRVWETIGLSGLFSIPSSVLGALIYFALHFRLARSSITAIIVAMVPDVLIVVPFVVEGEAYIWRTRFKT